MLPPTPPLFVLLGRAGDLIQIFPCFREIWRRTGYTPRVLVSMDYSGLFDGITYAEAYVVREHWWQGMPTARKMAESLSANVIIPQWWHDDPEHARMIAEGAKGNFIIQCHGINWGVDTSKWPDYGTSMASRCGFTRAEWVSLPLVFDRRSEKREATLWDSVVGKEDRKVILYNFSGISSPFPFLPEVVNKMRNMFGRRCRFIDLSRIRGVRIYDLLGLYDRAAGLLTSDTATLHLAPASRIPYVAFTVDGWTGSVPKGNCQFSCRYSQTPDKMAYAMAAIERWIA